MNARPVIVIVIVIADDAALFRSMVATVLASQARVREAGDVATALAEIDRRAPDLVVLDIRMPPTHTIEGLDAALRLRARRPGLPVPLLSQRSRAVIALLAEGESKAAIGAQLHLWLKTVEAHVAGTFVELRLPADRERNRRALAALGCLRARSPASSDMQDEVAGATSDG